MHMPSNPVTRISVQDHLIPYLSDLMDAESIFDKFSVSFSPDGSKILTGSYSNQFYIFDSQSGEKVYSMQLAIPPTSVFSRRCGTGLATPPLYDPEGRLREIRIPKGRIKGVTEIRADQKVKNIID